jgi:hypothetical protein
MKRAEIGSWTAVVPVGWTVGSDGELMAVYPPDGDSYVQISTYRGPEDEEPSAAELWDFAADSLEPSWNVTQDAIRHEPPGFVLDAEGATDTGGAIVTFRYWPSRLLFATFYYSLEDVGLTDAVRSMFASILPASE